MGKIYKNKSNKSCNICAPHKHKWTDKKKLKDRARQKADEKEMKDAIKCRERCLL